MIVLKLLLAAVVGYLLGSINSSILLSRGWGLDVRKKGSGNAGATNLARIFGLGAGILAMALDMLKTALALWVGSLLAGDWGLMAGGMASLLGHCYPIFHSLRGGKGVSAGGIISLLVDWRVGLGVVGCFLLGAFGSKKVSVGSLLGALACTVGALIFRVPLPRLLLCIFATCIVIFQHRGNIKRLIEGTEPDFRAKK